ncbi:MAG: 16S rRNA (cytidine(1402)-2'-O)-methyltransferase [Holosporales bacterium]|jgi:16S rRNA (cytidine1402-2'-O)-methyltransferase|nr:16S rRNA (cytidine(1402)-2'-O)-methyltransferase [Holosporales bacterium]
MDSSEYTQPWLNKLHGESITKKLRSQQNVPGLYIVATPIGNLFDITIRALHVLSLCDVIIAEDTRVTGKLLNFYGIKKPLLSYHNHNEKEAAPKLLARLKNGETLALVSDAGSPLVSDPGYEIVDACIRKNIFTTYIPGASSVIAAFVGAGLPTHNFCFLGFVPAKSPEARRFLKQLKDLPYTGIMFETAKRLRATLGLLTDILGSSRRIAIAKELTKLHETFILGTIGDIAIPETIRGEITIVIAPEQKRAQTISDEELSLAIRKYAETTTLRQAINAVSADLNVAKNRVYKLALQQANKENQLP